MSSLFTTLMMLVSVTVNGSNSTAVSEKNFCYDQVGDSHYCYESIEQCTIVWKNYDIAESPWYNEDSE